MVTLGVAAGVLWVGIAGYLMVLGPRQRAIDRRLDGQPARGRAPHDPDP